MDTSNINYFKPSKLTGHLWHIRSQLIAVSLNVQLICMIYHYALISHISNLVLTGVDEQTTLFPLPSWPNTLDPKVSKDPFSVMNNMIFIEIT